MVTSEAVLKWADWAEDSPLYQHLCGVIAGDAELMRVINRLEHTPQLNILFAAVQYLMTSGGEHDLASFYPNFTNEPLSLAGVARPFRDFVLANEGEIVELGATRYTQTNECRRCLALLPMTWMSGLDRFHLVDVGTSAGLNLLLDKYHYRWGGFEWGPESPVSLVGQVRGNLPEPVDIEILGRTGIDLNPIDPTRPEERRWLESLVWPEHNERRDRLHSALELASQVEMDLVVGDVLQVLPDVLDTIPDGTPVLIMNSFVLNQFTDEQRSEFERLVLAGSSERVIRSVSMEAGSGSRAVAILSVDRGEGLRQVGVGHHHGEWVDFDPTKLTDH